MCADQDVRVRMAAAAHPGLSRAAQDALSSDADFYVRRELASNPAIAPEVLEKLSLDPHFPGSSGFVRHTQVRQKVAENPNVPLSALWRLARDPASDVREAVAGNRKAPEELLAQMECSGDAEVVAAARLERDRCPLNWEAMLARFGPIRTPSEASAEELLAAAADRRIFLLSAESDGYGGGELRLEVVPGDLGWGADPPLVWECFYLAGPGRIDNLPKLVETGWDRFSDVPGLPLGHRVGKSDTLRDLLSHSDCPDWAWQRNPRLSWQVLLEQFGPVRSAASVPFPELEVAVQEGRFFLLSRQGSGLRLDVVARLPGQLRDGADPPCCWTWLYFEGPGKMARLARCLPSEWPFPASPAGCLADLLAEPRPWEWVLARAVRHADCQLRISAARHSQIPFVLLELLALDGEPEVRMAVAQNPKSHRKVMAILVDDPLPAIRHLAIARMAKWMLDRQHS